MSLPKQVLAQAEEAERLEKQLLGQPDEPAPETPPEGEPNGEQPVAQPEPVPVQPEAHPQPVDPEEETWQARYKALQGKFNAEVPRLHSEVKELSSQLNAALTRLDEATRQAKEAPKSAEPLVTDQDVEAFGSDLIDVIKRQATEVARQEMAAELDRVEAEKQQLLEQLNGVSERQMSNDRRVFFADLERLVPDYEAVNMDPRFLDWLAEADPLSGMPRQEYLNNAYGMFDVQRTATVFNTWKQIVGAPQARQPAKKLERQVAPGTSKVSTQATQSSQERLWSQAEIEGFYRDVQKGAFRGNEAEQARIEAEIDLAVVEGRIR